MDIHSEMLIQQYKDNLPAYEKLEKKVNSILIEFVKELGLVVNSVESRVKTEKSLIGKLELKGYKYSSIFDITDIVGARVVTFYSTEVDKFAAKIEQFFEVDREKSIDKRKMHKIDEFGYMSLHYICRIPKEKYCDETCPLLNEISFEIQMRTTLQHVWATIYHDTGYKNNFEIPSEYLRDLNRLAGLLELADKEFTNIKANIDDYRKRIKSLVKNGDLKEVDLNVDSFNAFVAAGGFDPLNKRIAEINNMDISTVELSRFVKVLKILDFQTVADLQNVINKYSELAYQFMVRLFTDMDIDIIASNTGIIALITVYCVDMKYGPSSIKGLLDFTFGPRKSNERLAKKYYDICVQMGL